MNWLSVPAGTRVRVQRLSEAGVPIGAPAYGIVRHRAVLTYALPLEGETMHPGQPRDLDLDQWLDGIGFHPANNERKQLGHEAARQLVADLGRMLHGLLPAGRDKSLAFTALEDVLMRANRALALGWGPREDLDDDTLRRLAEHGPLEPAQGVEQYKAEQRGEPYVDASAGVANTPVGGYSSPFVEPDDAFLRREVTGSEDGAIRLQVSGSTPMIGGGYIDVAVLTETEEQAAGAIEEARREGYPFQGFHRTLHSSEEVTAAIQAIVDAAAHAGLQIEPFTVGKA